MNTNPAPERVAAGGVHAMDGGTAPRDWPPIDRAELARLAAHLPALAPPLTVSWHSPRPFSAAARVRGARAEIFVKRHDPRVRGVRAVLEEHRFIAHLRARGAAVPEVLALVDEDGRAATALELRGQVYEVHALAPGADLYGEAHSWEPARSQWHARALGAALGRLHRAAEGYAAPARQPAPLLAGFEIAGAAAPGAALDGFLELRPKVAAFVDGAGRAAGLEVPARGAIAAALAPWHARLRPHLPELAPLWVHNDWHASNAFWRGDADEASVSCAIDFGLCNLGCAAADLATALERNTIAWLQEDPGGAPIGRAPLMRGLLEGYCTERPLSAAERAALPELMALAHVEYALSEVDYFWGVLGNARNAALACPAFLLGHVRWFESPPGQSYLDALRAALAAPRAAAGE